MSQSITPSMTNGHASDAGSSHNAHDQHDTLAHPLPLRLLAGVFVLLLICTFLTVAATWVDFGNLNLAVALLIAFVKASLVCLYFMHLRYDSPLFSIVLCTAFLFLALFIGIALIDTHQYAHNIATHIENPPGQTDTPVRLGLP